MDAVSDSALALQGRPRVCLPVDLAQLRRVDVRIALRRRQLDVPEQFLNRPEVGAALEQMRGKRMAQRVRADTEAGAAPRHVPREQALHAAPGEAPSAIIHEERL